MRERVGPEPERYFARFPAVGIPEMLIKFRKAPKLLDNTSFNVQ